MTDSTPSTAIVAEHPAPWTVEYDGELLDVDHGPDVQWPWQIVDSNGETVVDFTGGNDVSEEVAHLIGAAPALRDALKMALAQTGGWIAAAQDALLAAAAPPDTTEGQP